MVFKLWLYNYTFYLESNNPKTHIEVFYQSETLFFIMLLDFIKHSVFYCSDMLILISRLPASKWTSRATGRNNVLEKKKTGREKDWTGSFIGRVLFSPTGPLKRRPASLITRPMRDRSLDQP